MHVVSTTERGESVEENSPWDECVAQEMFVLRSMRMDIAEFRVLGCRLSIPAEGKQASKRGMHGIPLSPLLVGLTLP